MSETPVVLSVDDEPAVTGLVRLYLSQAGYEVMTAGSADEALHAIRTRRPDLILLDLMLPDIDGFSFCELLRRTKSMASIPVALLTGWSQPASEELGEQLGARAYLHKPFTGQQLVDRVRELLAAPPAGAPAIRRPRKKSARV